ncbi:hypothetical protein ACFQ88_29560 [Paenibacillus sp. NPDC056579]|uniref:hypothetical protein n=1 Tax=unclassified Paenibacillus TaxID=185978 RepID=UPI001EF91FA0|nr:hypothetical protein [Paenibacillus sp. H1-7]ULL19334.1 hypothetical protein DVH26_35895 [Paenibacillus sp. H1-7]
MGNNHTRKITVSVGDTVKLPIPLRNGQFILNCTSMNCSIATCSNDRTSASVTGRNPGTTLVTVIVANCFECVARLVFAVTVEENEE